MQFNDNDSTEVELDGWVYPATCETSPHDVVTSLIHLVDVLRSLADVTGVEVDGQRGEDLTAALVHVLKLLPGDDAMRPSILKAINKIGYVYIDS